MLFWVDFSEKFYTFKINRCFYRLSYTIFDPPCQLSSRSWLLWTYLANAEEDERSPRNAAPVGRLRSVSERKSKVSLIWSENLAGGGGKKWSNCPRTATAIPANKQVGIKNGTVYVKVDIIFTYHYHWNTQTDTLNHFAWLISELLRPLTIYTNLSGVSVFAYCVADFGSSKKGPLLQEILGRTKTQTLWKKNCL